MLVRNGSVQTDSTLHRLGGVGIGAHRACWNKTASEFNKFSSATGSWDYLSSQPSGYTAPYTFQLPRTAGGLSSRNRILAEGDVTAGNLAGGLNAESDLSGSGTISNAALGLILSAVATLAGTGTLTADMVGALNAAATLAGEGDIVAALGAISGLVATLTGEATVTPVIAATAGMSADINVTGDVLTTANVAAAVWNALAASFNESGTMGEKLNSASSAGDPWGTLLPGAYGDGTAGKILGEKILRLSKFLALK